MLSDKKKIIIKKRPIVIKKRPTINPKLKSFLEEQLFISIPTKPELIKIINLYILENRLQSTGSSSRQTIILNNALKALISEPQDTMTIFDLHEKIIDNSGRIKDANV